MKAIKYILGFAAAAITLAACTKTGQEYTPTPAQPGANVYFADTLTTTIDLPQKATGFTVAIARCENSTAALDVAISAKGTAIDGNYVTVPGTVHFDEGQLESKINVTVDPDALGLNNVVTLTLALADPESATSYGMDNVTLNISIPLPWVAFDAGVFNEEGWGEWEEKTLYYQQVSDDIRYCRIPECFGKETIAGGDPFDVQDYFFYWNTKTDVLYPCLNFSGYTDEDGWALSFCDLSVFYAVLNKLTPSQFGEEGTETWFKNIDAIREQFYNQFGAAIGLTIEEGTPFYDGNGGFYLTEAAIWSKDGSFDIDDGPYMDNFICNNFIRTDYTSTVNYDGMVLDAKGVAKPIVKFTGTSDVAGLKWVLTAQDVPAAGTLQSIVDGSAEEIKDAILTGGEYSEVLDLEPGLYRILAVPYGTDGVLQQNNAVLCDFYFSGATVNTKEMDAQVALKLPSEVYTPQELESKGLSDYSNLTLGIKGDHIVKAMCLTAPSEVLAQYEESQYGALLEANGSEITGDRLAFINSAEGLAINYQGLQSDTEYQSLVALEDAYGNSNLFVRKASTKPVPYTGELVVGDYTLACTQPNFGTITVAPTTTENQFLVFNLLIPNGAGWYATYSSSANTLTLNGVVQGQEKYGNQFGAIFGVYAQGYYYGIDSFNSAQDSYDEPMIFNVDPSTHKLVSIVNAAGLAIYDSKGAFYTYLNVAYAGAAVTYVEAAPTVKVSKEIGDLRLRAASKISATVDKDAKMNFAQGRSWTSGSMKVFGCKEKKMHVHDSGKSFLK